MDDNISIKKSNVSYREEFNLRTPKKSQSGSRQQQPTPKLKTILMKPKRQTVLQEGGIDVTPRPLFMEINIKDRQIKVGAGNETESSTNDIFIDTVRSHSQSVTKYKSEAQQFKTDTSAYNKTSYLASYVDDVFLDDDIRVEDEEEELGINLVIPISTKIPTQISLILNETETFFLLDLPSCTELKDTEEGDAADEDNKKYEFLTIGKGRNRKVVNIEVQTVPILQKTRNTEGIKVRHSNNYSFVSNWEMYDTYNEADKPPVEVIDDDDDGEGVDRDVLQEQSSVLPYELTEEEKQMKNLLDNNPKFLEAVCVIERLLANNYYKRAQMRFRGLSDEHKEKIEYNYRLDLLWTFASDKTVGKSVTAMEWNPSNDDLIAIGYGKYYYTDTTQGMVMIWNIKNPIQAERQYNFTAPVTSLCFSKFDPHLLAVGLYNGALNILDVTSRTVKIIRQVSLDDSTFEPTWQIIWYKSNELMAGFQDGRVCRYIIIENNYLKCITIMRAIKAEGELKGCRSMRICKEANISLAKCSAVTQITLHPVDSSIYYVGTAEGTIHKCSLHYFNKHLDVFRAHNGAVRAIKFSQFANKIYWTIGDDLRARLWVDGISQPLNESLVHLQPVIDIDLSPTHSTILASIRDKQILIWDIQRKLHAPQSTTMSPTKCRNTICKFTKNGGCLVVGDIEGNVHIFALEDLPFPAFFQYDLFYNSVCKIDSVATSDLKRKLKGLGKLCY